MLKENPGTMALLSYGSCSLHGSLRYSYARTWEDQEAESGIYDATSDSELGMLPASGQKSTLIVQGRPGWVATWNTLVQMGNRHLIGKPSDLLQAGKADPFDTYPFSPDPADVDLMD